MSDGDSAPETIHARAARPADADELAALVADAHGGERPLALVGAGTKQALGKPLPPAQPVELSAFTGIDLYEPEELVLAAGAATPMPEIAAALADKGQELAFEPPDLGPLLGHGPDAGTIGGALACGLAGPRRVAAGSARDHLLGAHLVTGTGERIRAGSRVVKNVTGYDLPKLMCGSFGTLAAMTQVTLKVLPAAEATRTILLRGLNAETGVAALTAGLQSAYAVSGAAHIPHAAAKRASDRHLPETDTSLTLLRVEGAPKSAVHRAEKLARHVVGDYAKAEILEDGPSRPLWHAVRDVAPLLGGECRAVWRLAVPPSEGARVAAKLCELDANARWYLDQGGGRIWLDLPEGEDARHREVRAALAGTSGHATLIAAGEAARRRAQVFQPQDAGLAALTRKVKAAFDPAGILNPGRMDGAG
ncbi:glycolate oxidase FAD binding subunit [Limimonas halophila]|uniref:Glycolate oxidase FAD binding subunit n=1 Tax=Limimonas halophila TaxID=1082479 RepID=A0A1G7RCZ5_9PROT|nr:FAD-binding protein [Limimonas halophila]SDG07900.1 glycolate oxidase FAD binding subunit [Limimonas halophila]